ITLKQELVAQDPTEQIFYEIQPKELLSLQARLHSLEGLNERIVSNAYDLETEDVQSVIEETGSPAGWYPLIVNYDVLSSLSTDMGLPLLSHELLEDISTHERISVGEKELTRVKNNLRV